MLFLPRDPHEIQSLLSGKTFRVDERGTLISFTNDVLLTESGTQTPYTVVSDGAGDFTLHAPGYTANKSRLKRIKFITQGCTLLFLAWQLGANGPTWSLTEVPEGSQVCALSYR